MKYEAKAWAEPQGACLRNFDEQGDIKSVNGALALRSQIEKIIDQIWDEGFDNIYFIGIGGTYASAMQVEVYMRGKSSLPVYVENAAEYLTTGNKRLTSRSVVIYSTVSGNTKEMVQLIDKIKADGVRVIAFIDTPGSTLTQEGKWDHLVLYPKNEQLKFYMVANYLMYKNGEFPEYERYNKEMVQLIDKIKADGVRVIAFIDTPGSTLTQEGKWDHLVLYPKNEQLKFYMVANYLMYKNGEFPEYERYNKEMEAHLAQGLVEIEKAADAWAYDYAKNKIAFLKDHPDLPHYFVGAGNQWGATYSYAMCYWEEQMWIRTKSITCPEFFHGMQEILVDDTPVTLFMGEDEQRPLAERVARFLPKVCANYTIIDTKELPMEGISPEFRGSLSHLMMHAVNNRVDAYMELFLRHPLSIRRYYRQFDY